MSTIVGISVISTISGSFKVGSIFAITELIYKPIQYYAHERIWYKYIKYGLKK